MKRRVAKKRESRERRRRRKWARQWKDRAWHVIEYVELWKQEIVHAAQMAVLEQIEADLAKVVEVIRSGNERKKLEGGSDEQRER